VQAEFELDAYVPAFFIHRFLVSFLEFAGQVAPWILNAAMGI
jgi:hypothetical protein